MVKSFDVWLFSEQEFLMINFVSLDADRGSNLILNSVFQDALCKNVYSRITTLSQLSIVASK